MVDNFEEYMLVPKCFENDFQRIIKYTKANGRKTLIKGTGSNRIFEFNRRKSCAYLTSIVSDLSPGLILDRLKEYHEINLWFPYVHSVELVLRINEYCDILEIRLALPILSTFNITHKFRIIRFWSYSAEEQSYYLLFKTIDNDKYLMNIIKYAGFIINIKNDLPFEFNSTTSCILTYFIKITKPTFKSSFSLLFIPLDFLCMHVCQAFCSSLVNFIGSIRMHKFCALHDNCSTEDNENDNIDAFKFLRNYFSTVHPENNASPKNKRESTTKRNTGMYMYYTQENPRESASLNLSKARVTADIEEGNLQLIKSFIEVKNEIARKFENDGNFKDSDIRRFVKAYEGNVNKILSVMEDYDHFRKIYRRSLDISIDEGMSVSCSSPLNFPQIFNSPFEDKYNRPVIIFRAGLLTKEILNSSKFMSYLICFLERVFERMKLNVDMIVVIADIQNLQMSTVTESMKKIEEIAAMLSRFYVERLGDVYVINTDYSFSGLWKEMYKVIAKITSKISICHNLEEDLADILPKEAIAYCANKFDDSD